MRRCASDRGSRPPDNPMPPRDPKNNPLSGWALLSEADPKDFAPGILRVQDRPPSPLGRRVLWTVLGLFGTTLLWALLGRLDIVAVADGKLVPASYLKIVQPAEQGIVKEILVKEGEAVGAGQVLVRMDPVLTDADVKSIQADHDNKRIAL